MSRKTARENAFKLVYEFCVNNSGNEFTQELINLNVAKDDVDYTNAIYLGVQEHFLNLTSAIKRYSIDFAFERIYKVDLSIMLVSAFEILFRTDIPIEVSINEALEIAKIYSTEKSVSFINGILASIVKNKEALINERTNN